MSVAIFTTGCTVTLGSSSSKDTTETEGESECVIPYEAVPCTNGVAWPGKPSDGLCFLDSNYDCDDATPISNRLVTDPDSFISVEGLTSADQVERALSDALGKWGFTNDTGVWSTPHGDVVINHGSADSGGDVKKWERYSFFMGAMDDSCVDLFGGARCASGTAALTFAKEDPSTPGQRLSTQTLVFSQSYVDFDSTGGDEEELYINWDLTDDPSAMATYSISLPTVLGHEYGHVLAFDENYADETSMMYYTTGWGESRSPQRYELEALAFVYD